MTFLMRQHWSDAARWHETGEWRPDTLPGLLAEAAEKNSDGVAVVDGDRRVSWRELRAAAGRFAGRLAALGVDCGDVVVIRLPDSAEFLAVSYAVHAVEAVTAPLVRGTGDAELLAVVERTRARAVVTTPGAELPPAVHPLPVLPGAASFWAGEDAPLPPAGYAPDPDTVAEIMFTSGTTGRPKGVMNTANSKLAGLRGLLSEVDFAAADVWGVVAPLSHNAGWLYTALPALCTGARAVIVPRGDPAAMLDLLTREKVTATFLVPTHLVDLISTWRTDPGRWPLALRYVLTGAAPAAETSLRAVADDWGATPLSLYGMTECQANLFTRAADPIELVVRTVGRPCPGSEVALRDPVGGALVQADGQVGEIVTRGSTTFAGYYDDQAATAAGFTKDGWFRSGDLAVTEQGAFRVVGRLKEVILRGGATVAPPDVEAAVSAVPGVGEVAVIGVPDERLGERVVACVLGGSAPSTEEVRAHLAAAGVGRHLFPDEVRAVDEFPRTDLGKVQRAALRRRLVAAD
jgi:acyl-CoA synthetase (AMP-forming)/AMP-acid ligase II